MDNLLHFAGKGVPSLVKDGLIFSTFKVKGVVQRIRGAGGGRHQNV